MTWINPFELNMNISRNIYEGKSNNCLIATAQKIAIYLIIPLALVVFFEAIVKNMIVLNLANLGIAALNAVHNAFVPEKTAEQPVENAERVSAPAPLNAERETQNEAPVAPPAPAVAKKSGIMSRVVQIGSRVLQATGLRWGSV